MGRCGARPHRRPAQAADPDLTDPVRAPDHCDVLIVGAGSAGSVVAERLSADPGCRVTVLESGPGLGAAGVATRTGNGLQLPIGASSPLVARFNTVLTDAPRRAATVIRGATVGGSGAVNGGYFCRALPADVDAWNLAGWSWPEAVEHYRAIETDLDYPHSSEHGDRGPIPVRRARELVGATGWFAEAAQAAGYPWLPDLNDGVHSRLPTGIGAVPSNIVDGIRTGPGAAFLAPALARPNLTLVTGARARRIVLDGGRATGVELAGPDGPAVLTADRIVLSAGAIGSAHLLMLSGVGEEGMLHAAGIELRVPAAVGLRCADHPEWVLPVNWPGAPSRPVLEVVLSLAEGVEIRPYTAGFAAMVGDDTGGHPDRPHIGVALMRPRARGRLTVRTADPAVPPDIEHHYDSDPADLADLAYGVGVVRELVGAATELGDPQWSTSQHLCGSARMGREDDRMAVVDERCRVRGVDNLWVVDGSVLPDVPSRGPHATTVMLAHRAAAFVIAG